MAAFMNELSRRKFLKQMAAGAVACNLSGVLSFADATDRKRQVLVLSDSHIGLKADGVDGREWLMRALSELKKNRIAIDYAMTLGDIAHQANEDAFNAYVDVRDKSGIKQWFEVAGNHEYDGGNLNHYEKIVRSAKPYKFVDGNVVWFFLSDEKPGVPGNISADTYTWLRKGLAEHQNDIVIVCTHQLVHGTVRKSGHPQRHIHPKEKIADLLSDYRIDMWMCGHEHHRPYSPKDITRKDGTTFINVASMSHAYGTKQSQSFLLEFVEGAKKITARRRAHDTEQFAKDFKTEIPLNRAIRLHRALPA